MEWSWFNFLMLIIHIHKYESDLSKKNKDIEEKYYNLTASFTLVW